MLEYTFILIACALTFVGTILIIIRIKETIAIKQARAHAESLGLSLLKCTRDSPYWDSYDFSKPPKFKRRQEWGYCLQYSQSKKCQWSLLQRNSKPGSEFPPAWQLVVDEGEINDELKALLLALANEWKENYMEIISTADSVCIYWKEWGGEMMAEKINGYLNAIDKAGSIRLGDQVRTR